MKDENIVASNNDEACTNNQEEDQKKTSFLGIRALPTQYLSFAFFLLAVLAIATICFTQFSVDPSDKSTRASKSSYPSIAVVQSFETSASATAASNPAKALLAPLGSSINILTPSILSPIICSFPNIPALFLPPTNLSTDNSRKWSTLYWEKYNVVGEHDCDDLRDTANKNFGGVLPSETREIVCWGDSLTEGVGVDEAVIQTNINQYDASFQAYPEILQHLCGIKTYNFGIRGASSLDIVETQNGTALASALEAQRASKEPLDLNSFVDTTVATLSAEHKGDIILIQIGSNGGWNNDYNTLIAQIKSMIAYSGCKDYLVLGDTDDPGRSRAGILQKPFIRGEGHKVTEWEQALQEAFGDHFVNLRLYLVERGLESCGLIASPADLEGQNLGCIAPQLRADWTHLNSYGHFAEAVAIYEQGVLLGYWE